MRNSDSASPDPGVAFVRRLPIRSGFVALGVGALVILGWQFDVAVMKSVVPGLVAMNPMTAVSFILAGLSLLLHGTGRASARAAGKALAAVVAVVGLVKLGDLVLHSNLALDQVLFSRQINLAVPVNRMAPNTALNLALLGAALLAMESHEGRRKRQSRLLVLPVLLLSLMALLGYAYGVRSFYGVGSLTPMALHTALLLWLLGLGIFFTDAERGVTRVFLGEDPGGLLIRRLVPFVFVGMPLLGWLRLRGEHLGLYDRAFGVSLLVLLSMVFLLGILWHTAERLRQTDLVREEAALALRQAHDDLEARVRDRTAELESSHRTLTAETLERRGAEEHLRLSHERFRTFMDHGPAVAFIKDREGRWLYVNRPFEETFRRSLAEVEGRTNAELWPEDIARDLSESDRAVRESGRLVESTQTIPLPDGTPRQWLNLMFPLDDPSGGQWIGGMAIDITDRLAAEEALRKTEHQLRQAQRMEAVGRLAGGIAHDFNNLLSVILGYSELLIADPSVGESVRAELGEITKAGGRAADLTRQLLAFSRQQVLAPKIVDLNAVLMGVDSMLRRLVGEDVDLRMVTRSGLGKVKVDPGQIEQVVMNLVVNARDAMPGGGILTLETGNVELDEAYTSKHVGTRPGRHVMLAVTDTGTGMDAETQARIFEPFFTTKAQGKGTGLGLSTVLGIVQQSHGMVWAYSEIGRGTTFKVYLPRTDEAAEASATPAAAAGPARGSETILLAEDDDQLRVLARNVLQRHGYQVLDANGAEEALHLGARFSGTIHLLLTDIVMPKLSGRQLAERLAVLRPRTRVLFMSGYTDDTVVRHGVLEAGIAYLQKPFTPDTLARGVREVLDQPPPDTIA